MHQTSQTNGFLKMLALMFGFTIFSASVMSGANLATNTPVWGGVLALMIGSLCLAVYGGLMAYISRKKKIDLVACLKNTFGKRGSVIPLLVMVFTQVGWFGVGIAMVALPLSRFLKISEWVFVFIFGSMVIGTAFWGLKSLTYISIIAVPLVIILSFTTVGILVKNNQKLVNNNTWKISAFGAIALVIGTFISGATFVPNFTISAKSKKIAVSTTFAAFLVGNGLMIGFGFLSQLFTNNRILDFVSIAEFTGNFPVLICGIIILIMNIWTTNDSALYSVSLGIHQIVKIPWWKKEKDENENKIVWISVSKKIWVVVFGLIATSLSMVFFENFIGYLSWLNCLVPPVGAMIIASYFFPKTPGLFFGWKTNWENLFILALATGIVFIPVLTPYAPFISFGLSFFLYFLTYLLEKIKFKKND